MRSCRASPACPARWTRAGLPMTHGDDVHDRAARHAWTPPPWWPGYASTDAAVIMKVGRHLAENPRGTGRGRAWRMQAVYVERATMPDERIAALADAAGLSPRRISRSMLVPGRQRPAMSGRLTVIGTGPGDPALLAPRAAQKRWPTASRLGRIRSLSRPRPRLAGWTDTSRIRQPGGTGSRPPCARPGRSLRRDSLVAVVSGRGRRACSAWRPPCSRPIEAHPEHCRSLDIEVIPGISALLAAAARLGAPLGHDFCAISLSDNLKPWPTVLAAAARGGWGRIRAWRCIIRSRGHGPGNSARRSRHPAGRCCLPLTPVAFATAISRPDERVDSDHARIAADPGAGGYAHARSWSAPPRHGRSPGSTGRQCGSTRPAPAGTWPEGMPATRAPQPHPGYDQVPPGRRRPAPPCTTGTPSALAAASLPGDSRAAGILGDQDLRPRAPSSARGHPPR